MRTRPELARAAAASRRRAGLRLLPLLGVALGAAACGRTSAPTGACDRIAGVWHGERAETDGGQDPAAVEMVQELVRNEAWRITRVTPSGLQRERIGAQGGAPIGEAMYIRENGPNRCVLDLRSRSGPRTLTLWVQPDGRLAAATGGNWYTAVYRRP